MPGAGERLEQARSFVVAIRGEELIQGKTPLLGATFGHSGADGATEEDGTAKTKDGLSL